MHDSFADTPRQFLSNLGSLATKIILLRPPISQQRHERHGFLEGCGNSQGGLTMEKKKQSAQMVSASSHWSGIQNMPRRRRTGNLFVPLIRPRGYKTFFMLNSIEHEIFPAHKCLNANNCWHLNIYEQEK